MHLPKIPRGMRPSVPHAPNTEQMSPEAGGNLPDVRKKHWGPPGMPGKVMNKLKRVRGF